VNRAKARRATAAALRALAALAGRELVHFLALACVLWASLAVAVVALGSGSGTVGWLDPRLPARLRHGLLAWHLLALWVLAIPLSGAALLSRAGARIPLAAARYAATGLALAAAAALLLAWAVSWAVFETTGQFPGLEAVRLAAANPRELLEHAAHLAATALLLGPPAALATAALLCLALPAWVRRAHARSRSVILLGGALAAALCAVAAHRADTAARHATGSVPDPTAGGVYSVGELYATLREERAGLINRIRADVTRRGAASRLPRPRRLAIAGAPILPLEQYAARVDPTRTRDWNVIIILVESLRPDQLRVGGSRRVVMPAVEALAAESRIFTDHYSQASHSNYADLAPLSSHYPLRSPHYHVYPERPTYPRVLIYDLLKARGYRVGIFSSQNERWGGMIHYLQTGSVDRFLHAETYRGPTYVPRNDVGFAAFVRGSKRSGKIDDRFTVAEAVAWIDSIAPAPFFIYMNLQNSHVPYERPADFPPRFGPGTVSFPIRFGQFPRDSVPAVVDMYANSLADVDFQLGRRFDFLKRRGLWQRTIIVLTGDTGQAFYEHGFAAHAGPLYDEVLRVPLLIHAPGLAPGIDPRPAQHIDVPPTILDLLGMPPHPGFQGISLVGPPPSAERPRFLVAQTPLAHQYAVVQSGYKLIYDARTKRTLLYHLATDPDEKNELTRAMPGKTRELLERLGAWYHAQIEYYGNPVLHSRAYPPHVDPRP